MSSVLTTLVSLSLWIMTLAIGVVSAWGQADEKAKLVEGAKKEGKLIWYTSTNVTESKPLLDDFEKLYPGIKGEIFRASGEKTLNRIVTEARANHSEFDIVTISEVDALIDAKLLAPYRSPEAKSFIPEFKDPNGYWTAIYINYATIGYNPTLVSEKEAPKQWEDLLGSQMERQTIHRSRAVSLVRHLAQSVGPRAGAEIHARAGEAKYSVAQRPYADHSANGRRRISPRRGLCAPHRRDETKGRAGGVGEHGQSDRRDRERGGHQHQAATSEHGQALL